MLYQDYFLKTKLRFIQLELKLLSVLNIAKCLDYPSFLKELLPIEAGVSFFLRPELFKKSFGTLQISTFKIKDGRILGFLS